MILPSGLMAGADRAAEASAAAARDSGGPQFLRTVRALHFQGHGDVSFDPITFDAPFAGEPSFSSGVALIGRPNPAEYRLPQATLFLEHWVLDDRGLFVGAKLGASVFIPEQPNVVTSAPATCALVFHATFLGTAVKITTQEVTGPDVRRSRG